MPLARYREQYWFATEALAVNVPAHVFPRFSNIHAPLFADALGTIPLPNPLNTDASGFLDLWVENGDYWVFINGQAFYVIVDLDPGLTHVWPSTFQWTQAAPLTVWTIMHGLNSFPNVTVLSPLNEVITGDVQYQDDDNLTITFAAPATGVAYLRR
jgi:hypothetical protein